MQRDVLLGILLLSALHGTAVVGHFVLSSWVRHPGSLVDWDFGLVVVASLWLAWRNR
jgi:hypothetical protein